MSLVEMMVIASICAFPGKAEPEPSTPDAWIEKYKSVREKVAEEKIDKINASIEERTAQLKERGLDREQKNEIATSLKEDKRNRDVRIKELKAVGADPSPSFDELVPGVLTRTLDYGGTHYLKLSEATADRLIMLVERDRYSNNNYVGHVTVGELSLKNVDASEVVGKDKLPDGLYVVRSREAGLITLERVVNAADIASAFPEVKNKAGSKSKKGSTAKGK